MKNGLIKPLVKRAVSRVSPRLQRFVLERSAMERLKTLHRQGAPVRTVYDIGAHKGHWAQAIKADFPDAEVYLFEGNPAHAAELDRIGFPYHVGLLSDRAEQKKFFRTAKGGTGDSLYREDSAHYDSDAYDLVDCQTLDAVVAERGFPKPDLIKIDTQGAELDVLRGGTETAAAASFMLLECPVVSYNIGAPQLPEYVVYMDGLGHVPHKLSEVHDIEGVLVQVDILFAHRDILSSAGAK